MHLFPRHLQLSCTRKLTGNNYSLYSSFLLRHFRFLKLFRNYHTHAWKRSREALNIEQGISTDEILRTCVELTCALIGQSAQAHHVERQHWNPHQYQTLRLCRMIGGFTMEINWPNWQENHWIREMLRQGMVVARHATASEVVFQWRHIFFIQYGTRTSFSLVKKPNRKPIPYTGAHG